RRKQRRHRRGSDRASAAYRGVRRRMHAGRRICVVIWSATNHIAQHKVFVSKRPILVQRSFTRITRNSVDGENDSQ
ncbi:MAG: hypothetical protein ABIS14_05965, partial [Sphingomonas sp.]